MAPEHPDVEALSEMEQLIQSLEERRRSEKLSEDQGSGRPAGVRAGKTGRDLFVEGMPARVRRTRATAIRMRKKILSRQCAPSWSAARKTCRLPERMIERIVPREPYPVRPQGG
jgi:hypothetical protein